MKRELPKHLRLIDGGRGEEVSPSMDFAEARMRWAVKEGRRAAAWLIGTHRRQISRDGAIAFFTPPGGGLPRWTWFALLALRESAKWDVEELKGDGERMEKVWKVSLLAHPKCEFLRARRARNEKKRLRRVR